MNRGWLILLAGAGAVAVGCGSSATATRSIWTVTRCFRATHVPIAPGRQVRTLLGGLSPRPRARIFAYGVLVATYRDSNAAAQVFSRMQSAFPVLQHGNVVMVSLITPQPTSGQVKKLEACAFGSHARPSIGRLVVFGGRARSGQQVVLDSGCLACHRIGSEGNDGPGQDLSTVGARLTPAAIARVLRHPRAPMPPTRLTRRDFQALVAYLDRLR